MSEMEIPDDILAAIESNFHAVIMERVGDLITENGVEMPKLRTLLDSGEKHAWFPVPGMYGGFHYWFDANSEDCKVISDSWSRIWGGSGQRHEITAEGSKLVDSGFV